MLETMAEFSTIGREAVEKINAKLECSICFENFKEPKLLPCFHIFCKSPCLERLVVRDHKRLTLTCPTCRHLVTLSDNGVNGLQTDFHINDLYEIREGLEKYRNKKCENCTDQDATTYCHNCKMLACNECIKLHNKWKKNTGHKIINIDEMETDAERKLAPTKKPLMCVRHTDMKANIYCETCSDFICNDCTICLHKDHNYDLARDIFHEHKTELLESLDQLKTNLVEIENAITIFDTKTQEVTEQSVAVESDIHRKIDQLHTLLDERKVKLLANLYMITQHKLKELADHRSQVEISQAKMSSCLQYAEESLKTGVESEVLKTKKLVQKRIEQIMTEFDPQTIQPQAKIDIELVTDSENVQKACREFGKVTCIVISPKSSYAIGDGTQFAQAGKNMLIKVHPITNHNKPYKEPVMLTAKITHAKTSSTFKCDVQQQNGQHSISYRPILRGRHYLTININGQHIQNSPFKIAVCPSNKCLRKPTNLVTDIIPYSTTCNSKQEHIITNHQNNTVIILGIDKVIRKTYKMGQTIPSNVVVDHEDNIYITCFFSNSIIKLSPQGEFVHSIEKGDIQCNGPLGIAFNKNNKLVYVSDYNNHRILVLTTNLKLVRILDTEEKENGQLCYPNSLAFDSTDSLYVVDRENNKVKVFRPDGQLLREFDDKANGEKLKSLVAIAIDSNDTVYVTERHRDCISVFTAEGKYILSFGGFGEEEGQFNYICGISIGYDDSIIVADYNNHRLQIF